MQLLLNFFFTYAGFFLEGEQLLLIFFELLCSLFQLLFEADEVLVFEGISSQLYLPGVFLRLIEHLLIPGLRILPILQFLSHFTLQITELQFQLHRLLLFFI